MDYLGNPKAKRAKAQEIDDGTLLEDNAICIAKQAKKYSKIIGVEDVIFDWESIQYVRREIGPLATGTAHLMRSSFVPPPYQPSVKPLEKLAQIFIKDLRLETHHRGSYLVLRSMTPPKKMPAVSKTVSVK